MVKDAVMAHRKKEEQQNGQQFWPAMPKQANGLTSKLVEEELFCSKLAEAGCKVKQDLSW